MLLLMKARASDKSTTGAQKRPLYVHRRVTNPEPFIEWARSQGFKQTLSADDLHVTQVYSKKPIDWHSAGDSFDRIRVDGGDRVVQPLGDKGAVVLKIQNADLSRRWQQFKDAGASWDYDGYQPHVTISYHGGDVDLSKVEPYSGVIELGPEVFEPLDDNWEKKVKEEPMKKSIPLVLFFKAHVGPYLRGGKMVNLSGYQGRAARGAPGGAGQMSLFGSGQPLPPSPLKGKDPVASTPDLFADEPQHTEPTRELIAEHERLVGVLRSPSREDDKAEAEKQAAELKELKGEAGVTVTGKHKVRDPMSGTETHVTLSNGKTHRLQRLNATESMGLPGWHDLDGGFLADTEDAAISALLASHNKAAPGSASGLRATPEPDKKILFMKPTASPESKPASSNLSNNSPVVNKQESKMSDSERRAVEMAEGKYSDFTPAEMAAVLDRVESERGFALNRASEFQMRLNGERAQRRNRAEMAALNPTQETWVNKDAPKAEFDERMYGSPRMTNTKDQPMGYMGD